MSKKMNAAVAAVFEQYPEAAEVYACEDGNVFLPQAKGLAEHHCRLMHLPAPVRVERGGKGVSVAQLAEAMRNAEFDPEEAAPTGGGGSRAGRSRRRGRARGG